MKTIVTAAVASLIAILPAAAAPKAPPAPVPSASPDLDRPAAATRYCYDTEITGSRLAKRVCHTRADWKDRGVTVPEGL